MSRDDRPLPLRVITQAGLGAVNTEHFDAILSCRSADASAHLPRNSHISRNELGGCVTGSQCARRSRGKQRCLGPLDLTLRTGTSSATETLRLSQQMLVFR